MSVSFDLVSPELMEDHRASTSYMCKLKGICTMNLKASFKVFKGIHVHCRKFRNLGNLAK